MAREITIDELALLRSDTQFSKLYLAIFKPNTIYTAQLGTPPASNDLVYQIAFTAGSGTLGNVKANMALYVGTSAGADDLGKGMCRIRKAPIAGTFYIGLVSGVRWNTAGTIYLTVVDDFDWQAKHAITSGGDLLMDVDVSYSNQHSLFNPVPILGTHCVLWLEGASVSGAFDASDSWVIGSSISGYSWSAPGSSASSGMTTATPTITYNTPGCYSVYCTVTAANGKTTTSVRHVFVYDRDANPPATVFQLSQCIGDHDTGGWMFDMTMEAEASLSEIHDRALVVLFAEDWYGTTKGSIGPLANRENIVCVGRIVGESIRWDRETGQVHFTVQGPHYWLNKIQAFPIDLSFAGVADVWSEMPYLTVDRALFHILYWHSTVIETMDFYPTNDTLYTTDAKSIATKIWGQISDIAISKLMAFPGVDRLGRLYIEIDPQMVPEVDRDFPVVMALTDDDWEEGVEFQRVTVTDCSLISLNAQQVDAGGNALTRYSYAPGRTPLPYGEPESPNQMLCASQADSNQKAGLMFGWRTNPYPDVPVNFAMNNRMIDIFPRQFCSFSVAEGDTPRAVAFDTNLIPRRVALYFDGDTGYMHSEINFEGETTEQLSTDGDIPGIDDLDDISVPSIPSLPELPDLGELLPGTDNGTGDVGPRYVLVHDPTYGLIYTASFNKDKPIWYTVNNGLTLAQYQSINIMFRCPNGAIYVGYAGNTIAGNFIARAPHPGSTFVVLKTAADFDTDTGAGAGSSRLGGMWYNPNVSEQVLYSARAVAAAQHHLYLGSNASWTAKAIVASGSNDFNFAFSQLDNRWIGLSNGYMIRLNADASAVLDTQAMGPFSTGGISRAVAGITYHYPDDALKINKSLDDGDTLIRTDTNKSPSQIVTDPSGVYLMSPQGSAAPIRSSDGGYTWSVISGLTVSPWHFAWVVGVGTASEWIAVSSYVSYNSAFGTGSWIDKRGNIVSDIAPLLACDLVLVIGI